MPDPGESGKRSWSGDGPASSGSAGTASRTAMLLDWLALGFLPGLGPTLVRRLVRAFGSPGKVLQAAPEELSRVNGIGSGLIRVLRERARVDGARQRALRELERLAAGDIRLVCLTDSLYPRLLKETADPPILLYCRGNLALLDRPSVAVIGSRAASDYGRRAARRLARALGERGICVVSGLASGIDGAAHAGALERAGGTIAVLGCGIDVVYPRHHGELYGQVGNGGLLVSEYPLGTGPEPFHFPERNRIISGLSLGVVVVEAGLKSGSLITARLALEQGREVFGVPGRIDSAKSRGTHRLLLEGAKLVSGVEDILEELPPVELSVPAPPSPGKADPVPDGLSREEEELLRLLDVYAVSVDRLVQGSGRPAAEVLDILVRLELRGLVRRLPGQQYERAVDEQERSG